MVRCKERPESRSDQLLPCCRYAVKVFWCGRRLELVITVVTLDEGVFWESLSEKALKSESRLCKHCARAWSEMV